jgi:hypothetical protein
MSCGLDGLNQTGTHRGSRGARLCRDVTNQHSWVVFGDDCYPRHVEILDITQWSYSDRQPRVWYEQNAVTSPGPAPQGGGSATPGRSPGPPGVDQLDALCPASSESVRMLGWSEQR